VTSGDVPLTAVGDDRTLKVTVDTRVVERVIARSPKIAHFWLHGFLFKSLRDHRVTWLRAKGIKFGRRGADGSSKAIKVHRINEGPASPSEEDVVYRVTPKNQKTTSVSEAVAGLKQMGFEAFAGSTVLRVHEFGEDIRVPKFMAVPVGTRPGNPEAWLKRYPNKRLLYSPSKKKDGTAVLYEVQRKGKRGRPKKGATKEIVERLKLRFILTRFVEMDPTLNFYGMWDQLQSKRDGDWRGAASRMESQLQKGDPRDF